MECSIRRWKMEDAPALAAVINNPNIQKNLRDGIPFPYTDDDARVFIKATLAADPQRTFAFAVILGDTVIGSIGVFRRDNIHGRTAELGYYIAEPHWGKGFGTSAVKQICRYIFQNTDIVRIFAEPFAHNAASCRILEKCGFVFEGTLQKNAEKNGEILDMRMYALLKA